MLSGEKARSAVSSSLCGITDWNSVGMIIWRRRAGCLQFAGAQRKAWSITSAYQRDPQESKERMMQHLSSILPGASVQQLTKILKG